MGPSTSWSEQKMQTASGVGLAAKRVRMAAASVVGMTTEMKRAMMAISTEAER